jgi:hypothetical protein
MPYVYYFISAFFFYLEPRSWDSSVGIAAGDKLGSWEIWN